MEKVELEEILPIGEVPQNAKDDPIYEEYFIDVQRCFYPMIRSYRAANPSVSLKVAALVMTNEYIPLFIPVDRLYGNQKYWGYG